VELYMAGAWTALGAAPVLVETAGWQMLLYRKELEGGAVFTINTTDPVNVLWW
jgi:hypothetical protein